jgi:hypothetical protein
VNDGDAAEGTLVLDGVVNVADVSLQRMPDGKEMAAKGAFVSENGKIENIVYFYYSNSLRVLLFKLKF